MEVAEMAPELAGDPLRRAQAAMGRIGTDPSH